MWKFKKRKTIDDERSELANFICQLIVDKNGTNWGDLMADVKEAHRSCHINIDNLYELIEEEIPLFALYELLEFGEDNWGMTVEEYNKALDSTIEACVKYYYNETRDFPKREYWLVIY